MTQIVVPNTPVEQYEIDGSGRVVIVKREDLCCAPPGPAFSKIRGVYAHLQTRKETLIGALDTFHSKAGWAVAYCCQELGKQCLGFFPVYKADKDENGVVSIRPQQNVIMEFGGTLCGLAAGRSAILFHRAKKELAQEANRRGQLHYMMPNALKLDESVDETAAEVARTEGNWDNVIIPASSGTIAAGVIKGLRQTKRIPTIWIHLGYSRPKSSVMRYLNKKSGGFGGMHINIIDEGYAYKDKTKCIVPFPSNSYYDAKAWLWLQENIEGMDGSVMLWNIGS